MNDGVLIRFSQCLHTHRDRIRVFTGSRLRMFLKISWGKIGMSLFILLPLIVLDRSVRTNLSEEKPSKKHISAHLFRINSHEF